MPSFFSLRNLILFLSSSLALTITSPSAGSSIDPSQPIAISWTSTSSDPSSIDLYLQKSDSTGPSYTPNTALASSLSTSSGTFTIPANTIQTWGLGYTLAFRKTNAGANSAVLAETDNLTLSPCSNCVQTNSAGQLTLVTSSTAASAQGPITQTSATKLQSATGVTLLSGTVTPETMTGTATRSSGFVTVSTSKSSNSGEASATSAGSANTANGQLGQMRGKEVVLGAAGLVAGFIALVA